MNVRFDRFGLDAGARQLTGDGQTLHLSPKAFDLLTLLVERRPAVVEKAEIRQRLWPGVHVVEASLSNLIAEIRAVLTSHAPGVSLIRTVHGVGYAFAGAAVDADADRVPDPARPAPFWVVWNGRPLVLAAGANLVGRDAACAVWVDASGVSRRHARIHVPLEAAGGADVTIEDLNSTNGTYLRGRRVEGRAALENGDRIQMGDASLTFRAWKGAEVPTRRVRRVKEPSRARGSEPKR